MRSSSSPPTPSLDRSGPCTARLRGQSGFTLIEVLVSALMLVFIASAAAGALISTGQFSGDQRQRSQADELAAQDQDRLRGLSDQQLDGLNQYRYVTLGGTTFKITSTAAFQDASGDTSCASTAAAYYQTTSTISWSEPGGTQNITEQSLLSRPVSGDLGVKVTTETGASPAGLTVTATGPSVQTASPDANGCIIFAGLTPGSYTVTMSDPGYVTPTGATAASIAAPATVTTTGLAQPTGYPFHLGQGGSIAGSLTTSSGATAEADQMSWSGTDGVTKATGQVPTTLPSPQSLISGATTPLLYPFNSGTSTSPSYTGNYAVWGGHCAGQEPPAPTDRFTVTPGSTNQSQTVLEPLLNVAVTYGGTAVQPSLIKLTYSDGSCSDTWTPTLNTTASTTPANGWLLNPGQPYAPTNDLTVCAQYAVTRTTRRRTTTTNYMASVTTANTSFTAANNVTVPITTTTGTC